MAINCVKAYKLLAAAQERLGRKEATVQSLLQGVRLLDQLGSRDLSADTIEGALKSSNG